MSFNPQDPHLQNVISDLQVTQGKHEVRLSSLEKLVENQNKVLMTIEKRITVIGTLLILVIGASSEQGGNMVRSLLGM